MGNWHKLKNKEIVYQNYRYVKLQAWQTQYGDVVRLGPNTIGVADKQMLRQILFKDDIPKGPAYKRLQRMIISKDMII